MIVAVWIWMHFAQTSAIVFFGGSFAKVRIGFGTVEAHIALGGVSPPSTWEMLADSTPYSLLERSDCFFAPEPRKLEAPEAGDPFSDYYLRPPLRDTLVGIKPSFISDRSPDLSQYILTVPFYFIAIAWTTFVAILFRMLNRNRGTEQGGAGQPTAAVDSKSE